MIILSILALVTITKSDGAGEAAKVDATLQELDALALAIHGDPRITADGERVDFGYTGDIGAPPSSLIDLVSDPGFATWNGPYLRGVSAADAVTDSWNSPYSYDGLTIVSNGSGSPISKRLAETPGDLTNNTVRGVITDARNRPPGAAASQVSVTLTVPDCAGGFTTISAIPTSAGVYTLTGVPIGRHSLLIVNGASSDTLQRIISVAPKSDGVISSSFGVSLW